MKYNYPLQTRKIYAPFWAKVYNIKTLEKDTQTHNRKVFCYN